MDSDHFQNDVASTLHRFLGGHHGVVPQSLRQGKNSVTFGSDDGKWMICMPFQQRA